MQQRRATCPRSRLAALPLSRAPTWRDLHHECTVLSLLLQKELLQLPRPVGPQHLRRFACRTGMQRVCNVLECTAPDSEHMQTFACKRNKAWVGAELELSKAGRG